MLKKILTSIVDVFKQDEPSVRKDCLGTYRSNG